MIDFQLDKLHEQKTYVLLECEQYSAKCFSVPATIYSIFRGVTYHCPSTAQTYGVMIQMIYV
jgi:hypothetical protein